MTYFEMYYDRMGEPLDLWAWARLMNDWNYRVISQQRISDYFVSTVWIGLNHNVFTTEPIGIFETAIFHGGDECELYRSDTQGEAVRWHLWVCSVIVRHKVKQLGPGSKVLPSTDRGPQWVVVTATTDGQLTVMEAPSGLIHSSERK